MKYNRQVIYKDCISLYEKVKDRIKPFRKKTVLITGSNGLLGSFLADFFSYLNDIHGFETTVYLTSLSSPEKAKRIQHLIDRSGITYFSWDMSKPLPPDMFEKIDYAFFMSGYGQPKKFIQNRLSTIFLNTVGLNSLLEICSSSNGNLLFASSSEIYGDPDERLPHTDESYNGNYSVESNRACYITSKRLGEVICHEHAKSNPDMKVHIARIALAYGPGVLENDDRVLQDFILKGSEKGLIKLLDDGSSVRNYLYITDCMEMLLNIMLHGKHPTYNVGGFEEETTIFGLASIVGNTLGINVEKGLAADDFTKSAPKRVSLSMQRYNEEFGKVQNFVNLSQGIKNVVSWYGLTREKNENNS
jgi:UDP-glucuronate decarboxylase